MAGLTKEQREAKQKEQEEKLRKELEENIRKEYEKKLKEETSNIKKDEDKSIKAKKIQNSTKIPLDTIIPVTSNFEGLLYFESKKTMGYSVEWDSYGSTEYIELSELVGMRNSYRRFFEDNWIIVEDIEDYSAGEIYSFLKVDKYYQNVLTPDNIDELFKKEPKEVIKIVSTLSNGMKDIIKTKAKVMYDNKKLDSNKMIEALEAALNISLASNLESEVRMTTKYSDIYAFFKDKITDYDLLMHEETIQNEILLSLLNQGCAKFQRICKNDLSLKDDTLMEFPFKLSLDEIDILTDWMVESWVRPYLNNIENMRNHLSTKDFSLFSPANLLDKMQIVYDSARKNARSKMNEYSFINSDLERIKS